MFFKKKLKFRKIITFKKKIQNQKVQKNNSK